MSKRTFGLIFFGQFAAILLSIGGAPHWTISASLGVGFGALVKFAVLGGVK